MVCQNSAVGAIMINAAASMTLARRGMEFDDDDTGRRHSEHPLRRPSSFAATSEFDEIVDYAVAQESPNDQLFTLKELIHGVVTGFAIEREPPDHRWVTCSLVVTNAIFVVIGFSVVEFAMETLPQYRDGGVEFDAMEAACVAIFSLEFLVRCVSAPSQFALWTSPLTWIDVLSIIPYYVTLAMASEGAANNGIAAFRILRLVRVIRIFKLMKNNIGFEAVFESLVSSKEALSLMGFMLVVAVATFSAAIYFAELQGNEFDAERREYVRPNGEVNPYQSMFHAFWWCIVTITTVGYGDDVPITGLGKAIAGFAAICGVFVISFPTAILGANFAEIHTRKLAERNDRLRRAKRAKDALLAEPKPSAAVLPPSHSDAFLPLDTCTGAAPRTLTYTVQGDVSPRSIFLDGTTCSYAAALVLQTSDLERSTLVARREDTFPRPARIIVFNLVLADDDVENRVRAALIDAGIEADNIDVTPRPVHILRIAADIPPTMINAGIRLQTCEVSRPCGHVPINFFCPTDEAEELLFNSISALCLDFRVSYEPEVAQRLSLQSFKAATLVRSKTGLSTANLKRRSIRPVGAPGMSAVLSQPACETQPAVDGRNVACM
jgi:hypothetical protein